MMTKKILLAFGFCIIIQSYSFAQSNLPIELQKMQENAKVSLGQGDYANSIMLLNQAIRQMPNDVSLRRDLSYTYYLSGKVKKAKEVIDPVVSSEFADELTFQLAAAIEGSLDNYAKSKKILKNGIKKFPHSGLLYNSQGNLYSKNKSDKSAMASWTKGIEKDPTYAQNYSQAAKQYFNDGNAVWAVLYTEIALNLDDNPTRVPEMKKLLAESYQLLFSPGKNEKLPEFYGSSSKSNNNSFAAAFRSTILQNATLLSKGFDVETLIMLRTRFLLSWQNNYANQYPFTLFTYQQKLLQNGYFDAYNQWLFGSYSSSQAFSAWVQKHSKLYKDFEVWKKNNPLQPASFDPKP